MRRRSLLLMGAAVFAGAHAWAQPMPLTGPVGGKPVGGGPLWSLKSGPPGVTMDLSFMTPGTLPSGVTFTRASTATYFDNTGTMQSAAANAARWDYNPSTLALNGLFIEEARTNGIRNSTMVGAAAGTPGILPTNWTSGAGSTTLSQQVIGTGTESGIPYIDIRLFGTAVAGTYLFVLDGTTNIAALTGQTWTDSVYWRLVGGTATNLSSMNLLVYELTSGGALVKADSGPTSSPTGAALNTQRISYTVALSGGGTVANVQPRVVVTVTAGPVDMTLRLGAPQLEQGAFVTSFIPTTSAAVARSADVATIASIPGRNTAAESFQAETLLLTAQETNSRIIGAATTAAAPLYATAARNAGVNDTAASLVSANTFTLGNVIKLASTWATPNAGQVCLNAGTVASATTLTAGFSGVTSFKFMGDSVAADQSNGYLRRFRYWPRVLTNAEMQQVTT